MRAYVLLSLTPGEEEEIARQIRGQEGVLSFDIVSGPWDAVVHIEAEDLEDIDRCVTSLAVEGVEDTQTNFVIEVD
jgi:DNA-binding Lrp family transcriptional regulator